MEQVRFGILGNAAIARNQMIPALSRAPECTLYAIASRREVPGEVAPGAKRYASYEALLDDPMVEAVYVPAPNALHAQWAIAALRKGKHVLCEKPIAMSAAQAQEMFDEARRQGVLLMEAFMYRYSDKTAKAAQLVREGKLGRLRGVHAHHGYILNWDSPARQDPKLGGGSLYDVGCYCVSVIGHLLRQQGARLTACSAGFTMAGGYDSRMAGWLQYDNGALCTLESWFDAPSDQRLLAVGEAGILEAPRFAGGGADTLRLTTAAGVEEIPCADSDLFALEAGHFARAVRGGKAELISEDETVSNMRVMDALHALRKAEA